MSAQEKTLPSRTLELLRQGPFRRYIIGSAISDTGTWMQVMAQGWVMSSLTNQALMLGMVNFAAGIPTLALTMIGGSAADRHDKRMILIATQVVQIATAITLGVLVMTGRIQIWHVVLLAAVLGTCIAFEMPAISALVPELVKKGRDRDGDRAGSFRLSRFASGRAFPGGIICGVVGSGLRLFLQCDFIHRVDHRARFTATSGQGNRGRRRAAAQRIQGRAALRAFRPHHPFHDRADRADDDFRFPRHLRHAAALRAQRSASRAGPDGNADGHLGDRIVVGLDRAAQCGPGTSLQVHDRRRGVRGRRALFSCRARTVFC